MLLSRNSTQQLITYHTNLVPFARKIDSNQAEIMAALRQVGATVHSLHRVGQGVPDLLVGFRGLNYLLEVKRPKGGKTTPQQDKFHTEWNGNSQIVTSIDQSLKAIGAIKHAKKT